MSFALRHRWLSARDSKSYVFSTRVNATSSLLIILSAECVPEFHHRARVHGTCGNQLIHANTPTCFFLPRLGSSPSFAWFCFLVLFSRTGTREWFGPNCNCSGSFFCVGQSYSSSPAGIAGNGEHDAAGCFRRDRAGGWRSSRSFNCS